MKLAITGNPDFGIASELAYLYPEATFYCRDSGFDLTTEEGQQKCAASAIKHDVFINNSALWKFNQTVLLDLVYKAACNINKNIHIINIGSTTDRVKNGNAWLYNAEKKALRDYSNTLSINGVWNTGPKVSYISFGTLSNNKSKHPDRACLPLKVAADYIAWMINMPRHININEISIDPMQNRFWYD